MPTETVNFNGGGLYDDGVPPRTCLHNTIVAGNVVGRPDSDSPDDLSGMGHSGS